MSILRRLVAARVTGGRSRALVQGNGKSGRVSADRFCCAMRGFGRLVGLVFAALLALVFSSSANAALQTQVRTAVDVPKNIPNTGQISSSLNISLNGPISELILAFRIVHQCEQEVFADLIAPDGHTVGVMAGGNGSCTGVSQRFISTNDLIAAPEFFGGREASGTWTLVVRDTDANAFSGFLDFWSLTTGVGTLAGLETKMAVGGVERS